MKKLIFALLLTAVNLSQAWDQRAPLPAQACQVHSPWGWTQTATN